MNRSHTIELLYEERLPLHRTAPQLILKESSRLHARLNTVGWSEKALLHRTYRRLVRVCRLGLFFVPFLPFQALLAQRSVAQRRVQGELALEEVRAWDWPEAIPMAGASLTRTGEVAVLWSVDRPTVFLLPDGGLRQLVHLVGEQVLGAAFGNDDSKIEILTVNRIALFDMTGRALGASSYKLTIEPRAASRTDSGWLVAGQGSGNAIPLFLIGPRADVVSLGSLSFEGPEGDSTGRPVRLGAVGELGIVSSMMPPFETKLVDATGRVTLSVVPDPAVLARPSDDGRPPTDWVALQLIPLRGLGFVQVLSDLRSDLRVLILYDANGRTLRHSSVHAPIGFLASARSRPLLLAIRSINAPQIVRYRWHLGEVRP